MKINKEYRKGGFFGNSQDKFSDMEGAGSGINTAFKGMGPFAGKGSALRREKRYLKKLERQGKLNEEGPRSADRLEYLKKVQRDRIKKGVGGAALAAGAAIGAPALIGAVQSGGGLAGLASQAGSGLKSFKALKGADKLKKILDLGKKGSQIKEMVESFSPEQEEEIMEGDFGQPGMFGEFGMRVLKKGQKKRDKNKEAMLIRALLGAKLQA